MKIKDLTRIALLVSFIAICAWITIPATVPFTMQTFGVFCALGILGGKFGTIAIALYIAIGAVGIPVFSGFAGGPGVLFGVTGGYIWGFLAAAIFYWVAERLLPNTLIVHVTSMVIGLILCYAVGTIWFVALYAQTGKPIGFAAALLKCVVPFIIPDMAKLGLSVFVCGKIKKSIGQRSSEN